ncbi:MAG: restriction endonuclease [Deltaproteobacteria bacterium]|nr:restriction endonuclease [Deltaproteobacteria bacterium]
MPIPDYQTIMLPLLLHISDKQEHSLGESIEALTKKFSLTDPERRQLLPSGQQSIFENRVAWSRTYMKKAGLLESTRRGYLKITERGIDVLSRNPERIDRKLLLQFPEFIEFQSLKKKKDDNEVNNTFDATPEESLERAYASLRSGLVTDLLYQLKSTPPSMFEKIVVDLLLKMGYGGSKKDAGQAIGKSGDEGIDGIIKEDRLGLDIIYIQAKRWENPVGRPEIQKFAGALQGKRAKKGIFITTSSFSTEARQYAANIDTKLVLLDGEEMAELMIDHNVGVVSVATYNVNRLDTDYFVEE